jgi:hypothetical protein
VSTEAFDLGPYRVEIASEFGPRILGLSRDGGPELFASLGPEAVIDRPDSGVYRFRGGHRLWASPEVPIVTYAPDDEPCQVTRSEGGMSIEGPIDRAGLVKRMSLSGGSGGIVVDHDLINEGTAAIRVAPWALSQLRLGGVAIVPVWGPADEYRLSASSSLILWPYTDLGDPRLSWLDGAAVVQADPGPPFKIGTGPDPGKLGYLLEGHLFTKQLEPAGAGRYPDREAVGQVYLGDMFCELESLGPLVDLDPGGRVSHREVWEIEPCDDVETALGRLMGGRLR